MKNFKKLGTSVKRVLAMALSFVMVITTLTVAPIFGATNDISTLEELKSAVANGGDVRLTGDITIDGEITVASGKVLTLDLNGFDITRTSGGNVLKIDGTLNLYDNSVAADGYIGFAKATNSTSKAVPIRNTGTLNIYGGGFRQMKSTMALASSDTASLISNLGTINMYGGFIKDLTSTNGYPIAQGDSSHTKGVSFNIYGGEISGLVHGSGTNVTDIFTQYASALIVKKLDDKYGIPVIDCTTRTGSNANVRQEFSFGYYSAAVTPIEGYKRVALDEEFKGCKYRVVPNTIDIKFMDEATELTELSKTIDTYTQFALPTLENAGTKIFTGWTDGAGNTYVGGTLIKPLEEMTFTANWVVGEVVTVTFFEGDNQISSEVMANPISVGKGQNFTVPGGITKGGMVFDNWNTKGDGTGTPYQPGAEIIDVQEDLNLYAIFAEAPFTVTDGEGNVKSYETLGAAVADACKLAEATIKLNADVTYETGERLEYRQNSSDKMARTATLNMNGHKITADYNAFLINDGTTFTITGEGTIDTGSAAALLYANAGGKYIIENGTFNALRITNGKGNVEVRDGSFAIASVANEGVAVIYGGDFTFTSAAASGVLTQTANDLTIYGGSYNYSPYNYIDEDHTSTFEDGKYVVSIREELKDPVATLQTGDKSRFFNSLTEAFTDAALATNDSAEKTEATLILNKDITITEPLSCFSPDKTLTTDTSLRNIVFDFNGNTITTNGEMGAVFMINPYGTMTLVDNSDAGNGGVIANADVACIFGVPQTEAYGEDARYNINGGDYAGAASIVLPAFEAQVYVYGGVFDLDPTSLVHDTEYHSTFEGGRYTVKIKDFEAAVTLIGKKSSYTRYMSFNEALEALLNKAETGELRAIKNDIKNTIILNNQNANITIDLDGLRLTTTELSLIDVQAGHLILKNGTIVGSGNTGFIKVGEGATLTLDTLSFENGVDGTIESRGIVMRGGAILNTGIVDQVASGSSLITVAGEIGTKFIPTFNFNVSRSVGDMGKVSLKYEVDGKSETVDANDEGNNVYSCSFASGMPLWSLDEDLNLEVYIGENKVATLVYSIFDYFDELNETMSNDKELNMFLAQTINFVVELQKTVHEGNVSLPTDASDALKNIANNGATATIPTWAISYLADMQPTELNNKKSVKKGLDGQTITGSTLNILDQFAIAFFADVKAGDTLTIYDAAKEIVATETYTQDASKVRLSTPRIAPGGFDDVFTAKLTNSDGQEVSFVTYSVNTYAYKKLGSNVNNVVAALYKYGFMADFYVDDLNNNYGLPTYSWASDYSTCTAARVSATTGDVQSETVASTSVVAVEAQGPLDAEAVNFTAAFHNPAFETQEYYREPLAATPNGKAPSKLVAYEKKGLILNKDGSYGGNLNYDTYGYGAPKNGANDNLDSTFYATNDYYNIGSTATRLMIPHWRTYQSRTANGDGVALAMSAMDYVGLKINEGDFTEQKLVDKMVSIQGSSTLNKQTPDDLKKLFDYVDSVRTDGKKFNAVSMPFTTTVNAVNFSKQVAKYLKEGKLILAYYQDTIDGHWRAIIGHDNFGYDDEANKRSEVLITGNAFDAYDHYQDGYSAESLEIFWKWWKNLSLKRKETMVHAAVVVDIGATVAYDKNAEDPIHNNPNVPNRHMLLNEDGTFGGDLNPAIYGTIDDVNGYRVNYKKVNGVPVARRYTKNEHLDYGYYNFPDYYNMSMDTKNGVYIMHNYKPFQQTMASSCGICSTFSVLNYYGYDFSKLPKYISTRGKNEATLDIANLKTGQNEACQEAVARLYMDHDSTFYTTSSIEKKFNNYGGVGVSKLKNIPKTLGFDYVFYSNYTSSPIWGSYSSFKTTLIEVLSGNHPMVVSWCPVHGHYETIIGLIEGNPNSVNDDVIVLADSHDVADHYQDGYNTYPGVTFFGRWFNGSSSLGQANMRFWNK